ncbi:hypothetical protein GBA52_014911 [Prunus armeniaca]|nr:hypothetical protein GBA52_014911 [Prunus armeniaca]
MFPRCGSFCNQTIPYPLVTLPLEVSSGQCPVGARNQHFPQSLQVDPYLSQPQNSFAPAPNTSDSVERKMRFGLFHPIVSLLFFVNHTFPVPSNPSPIAHGSRLRDMDDDHLSQEGVNKSLLVSSIASLRI